MPGPVYTLPPGAPDTPHPGRGRHHTSHAHSTRARRPLAADGPHSPGRGTARRPSLPTPAGQAARDLAPRGTGAAEAASRAATSVERTPPLGAAAAAASSAAPARSGRSPACRSQHDEGSSGGQAASKRRSWAMKAACSREHAANVLPPWLYVCTCTRAHAEHVRSMHDPCTAAACVSNRS